MSRAMRFRSDQYWGGEKGRSLYSNNQEYPLPQNAFYKIRVLSQAQASNHMLVKSPVYSKPF